MASGCTGRPDALFQLAKTQFEHGDLASARQNAEAGYERFKAQPQSIWSWKYKLQWAGMLLDNGRTKDAESLLAVEPPIEFHNLLPRYRMLKGYVLYRKRQLQPARELLQSAKAGAQAQQDAELEADIRLLSGVCSLLYEGDSQTARDEFQSALTIGETRHLDYQRIAALINLGGLEIRREHYGDAFPHLNQAVQIARQGGFDFLQSRALGNIANCYQNLGQIDEALQIREQAVAIQVKTKSLLAPALSQSYSALGNIYLEKGDTTKAVDYFRKGLELVGKDAPVQYAPAAGSLAQALERMGALDEAERYNRAGLQVISQNDAAGVASLTLNEASIARRRGRPGEAKAAYEKVLRLSANNPFARWQAHAGLAAIYAEAGDFQSADRNYEQALQVIESNRADQLSSKYKISFLNSLIHLYQEYVAFLLKQKKPAEALEVADSSRARVLTEGLIGKGEARNQRLGHQLQQAAKARGCVFLFYWLAPGNSYLWITTAQGSTLAELADARQIERDVRSYRAQIEQRQDPLAVSNPAARRLYRTLIGPVEQLIPPGARVVIVPDGPLHNLNFETLVSDTPAPHYWLQDVTVSVAPSLGILTAGKRESSGQSALLLMGDPVAEGSGFEPLPEAAQEIGRVQQHFPGVEQAVYLQQKATPEAYGASGPHKFSTIHFATHVEPNEQSPLDSAIILSPRGNRSGYRLYARDVAEMPLNADLVTISACRGAGTSPLSGEGLVGFGWAFLQAGARNVVTSLWDANDKSTTELMDQFYAGIQAGRPYSSALKDAKLWMLQSKYRKPYYWAPFQLYSLSIDPGVRAESTSGARVSNLTEVNTIGKTGHINR